MRADVPAPVDMAVIGSADGAQPANDELEGYAAAGVTWVLHQALTVEDARQRIKAGPA